MKSKHHPEKTKHEAVKLWLTTGNLKGTAAALGIPYTCIKEWRYSKWWDELVTDIRTEGHFTLSSKLKKAAEKALDVALDRLDNGDWYFDPRTGELRRKGVNMRDAVLMANAFIDRGLAMEQKPIDDANQQKVQDRLEQLAQSFASFAKKTRKVEVLDVEDSRSPYEAIAFEGGQESEGNGTKASEQDGSYEGEPAYGEGPGAEFDVSGGTSQGSTSEVLGA